jgi:hypothetical protein
MIEPHILERQILILAAANADLRMALEEIDSVAVSKRAGAAIKMQAIARRALRARAISNGDRGHG